MIELNNRVLYTCFHEGSLFADGVFQYEVSDNILRVSFRELRDTIKYKRVIPAGDVKMTIDVMATSIKYYLVLYKVIDDGLGISYIDSNYIDDDITLFPEEWEFDISEIEEGSVLKVMIVGVLPLLKNNPEHFNPILKYSDAVNIGLTDEEFSYILYIVGLDYVVSEWLTHVVGGDVIVNRYDINSPLIRVTCNKWKIRLNNIISAEGNSLVIKERGYEGDSKSMPLDSNVLDQDGFYHFTLNKDGIYEITIRTGQGNIYTFYAFEYCKAESCYDSLINSIYCSDTVCCTGCSDEVIRDREFKRYELLKLNAFMNYISWGVNHLNVSGIGISLGDDYNSVIDRMVLYFDRLSEITSRCGTCGDKTVNKGCKNCK